MANLREFARCMALMSDKLQLMVSRDVTAVQPMPSPSELAAQGGPAAAAPLPPPAASVHSTASSHRLSLGTAAPHLHAAAAAPAPAEGRPPAVPLPDAAALVAATMAVPAIAGSAAGGTTGRISDHVSQTGLPLLGPHEGGGSADLQSPGAQPGSSRTHHSGPLLGLLSGGGGGGGGGLQGSGHLEALGSDGALGGEAGGGGVGVGGAGRLLASGSEAMRAHWANVARALNLSPQQRADTAALSELHGSWVRRVHTERQRLNGMLDQVLRVNKYGRVYQEGLVANSFTGAMNEAARVGSGACGLRANRLLECVCVWGGSICICLGGAGAQLPCVCVPRLRRRGAAAEPAPPQRAVGARAADAHGRGVPVPDPRPGAGGHCAHPVVAAHPRHAGHHGGHPGRAVSRCRTNVLGVTQKCSGALTALTRKCTCAWRTAHQDPALNTTQAHTHEALTLQRTP